MHLRLITLAFLCILTLLGSPSSASGAFTRGEVAVAASPGNLPVGLSGAVYLVRMDGSKQFIDPDVFLPAVGFDPLNRLLVSRPGTFVLFETDVYEDPSSRIATFPFGGSSFAFDNDANIYLVPGTNESIAKYSSSGTFLREFALPGRYVTSVDLAADQCTMVYVERLNNEGRIRRHDVCLDVSLPDVPTVLPPTPFVGSSHDAARVLVDGTILVLADRRALIIRDDGTVLNTFTVPDVNAEWTALALDETGRQFWVTVWSGDQRLYRVDMQSGAVTAGPFAVDSGGLVRSIAVVGGWHAATAPTAPIPALSTFALIALTALLALLGVRQLL